MSILFTLENYSKKKLVSLIIFDTRAPVVIQQVVFFFRWNIPILLENSYVITYKRESE